MLGISLLLKCHPLHKSHKAALSYITHEKVYFRNWYQKHLAVASRNGHVTSTGSEKYFLEECSSLAS